MVGKVKKFSSTLGAMLHESMHQLDDINPKVTQRKQSQNALAASAGKRRQQVVLSVDPKKSRLWRLHNRDQTLLSESNCHDLIDSIRLHGQQEPALVREVNDEPGIDFEVIYGSRRRFACLALGKDLDVIISGAGDRECAVLMDAENRARQDISDYERALDYQRWLDDGLYVRQKDLADAIGIDTGNLNRLLKLAQLPEVLIKAFRTPLDIRVHYGTELLKQWQDPDRRPYMQKVAEALTKQAKDGAVAFKQLTKINKIVDKPQRSTRRCVHSEKQTPLFYVTDLGKGAFKFEFSQASDELNAADLRQAWQAWLEQQLLSPKD